MPFYCNTCLSRNKKVPRPSVRRTGSHMKWCSLDIRGKRAVRSSTYHSATSASSKTSWSTECTTTLGYQIKTMCIMEQTKSCTWCPGSNLKKTYTDFQAKFGHDESVHIPDQPGGRLLRPEKRVRAHSPSASPEPALSEALLDLCLQPSDGAPRAKKRPRSSCTAGLQM